MYRPSVKQDKPIHGSYQSKDKIDRKSKELR